MRVFPLLGCWPPVFHQWRQSEGGTLPFDLLSDAMTEIASAAPIKAPGPMLGENGPLVPGFKAADENMPRVNKDLQDALEDVVQNKLRKTGDLYSYAVVDLTGYDLKDGANLVPSYAGWNDARQMYVASLAKLLPLYAAYQLRSDIRCLADALTSWDLSQIAVEARSRYQRMASASVPALGLPKIETFLHADKSHDPIIDFATVLDDDPIRGPVEDPELDDIEYDRPKISAMKAEEHLRLMVGWSNNYAASLVIQALGFNYLWAVGLRSGLYRPSWPLLTHRDYVPSRPGGLFLGLDYNKSIWKFPRTPGAPTGGSLQSATARSVAFLLSTLVMETLIDHDAHCGMLEMLRQDPTFQGLRGECCPIGTGMNKAGWEALQVKWDRWDPRSPSPDTDFDLPLAASKIGLDWAPPDGGGSEISSAFVVRASRGSKWITAVLVGINNNPDDNTWTMLERFGEEMAIKLDGIYGTSP
jgi:hypothetical protein